MNNEKDEELQLKQQSQEKSPEDEQDRNKMTAVPNKPTHKSLRSSPQRLAKSKTAKFKLEATLKQAELALIQSQNQYDLCKIALCFLLLLYNVYSDIYIYTCVLPFFFSFSFSLSLCVFTLSLPFFSSGRSRDITTPSRYESYLFSRGRTEEDVDRKCGEDDQTCE